MAPVTSPSKVLVSGASGYIAAWVVKCILDRGHTVIGTVRSSSKGEYLQKQFGEKFSYVIVEDIAQPGAFDEAIKLGVDAVVHIASPVLLGSGHDPSLVIGPAVSGTTGVLESITKHGPAVKRVVLTSSFAAAFQLHEGQYTYTEADWNDDSPAIVEKEGKNAGPHIYRASKVLAERAAWEYTKKQDKYDLVTMMPTIVLGPLINEVKDAASLGATPNVFWTNVTESPDPEKAKGLSMNYVDVRDVALAHALALESSAAGGERFILSTGTFQWQDHKDILRASGYSKVPEGVPGSGQGNVPLVIADGSKVERVLGFKYHSAQTTVVDMYENLRGLLAKSADGEQ